MRIEHCARLKDVPDFVATKFQCGFRIIWIRIASHRSTRLVVGILNLTCNDIAEVNAGNCCIWVLYCCFVLRSTTENPRYIWYRPHWLELKKSKTDLYEIKTQTVSWLLQMQMWFVIRAQNVIWSSWVVRVSSYFGPALLQRWKYSYFQMTDCAVKDNWCLLKQAICKLKGRKKILSFW